MSSSRLFWADGSYSHCHNSGRAVQCCPRRHTARFVFFLFIAKQRQECNSNNNVENLKTPTNTCHWHCNFEIAYVFVIILICVIICLAPFFVDCISEADLDEMNVELIRNTLYKAYLEAFYQFCIGLGGETADVMCEILAVSLGFRKTLLLNDCQFCLFIVVFIPI